jgi:alpha-mannosidase
MKKIIHVGIALMLTVCARAVLIEEPVPASAITVTASSTFGPDQDCRRLVDGSGMSGDQHDDNAGAATMWHTGENPTNVWVRFDFAQPVALSAVRIWNHNQAGLQNRGFRKTRLITSDGTSQAVELKHGNGLPERIALAAKTPVKSITIAGDSNHGGNVYGLSEVQFMTAREVAEKDAPFPTGMDVQPQPFYPYRKDRKPGRAIKLLMTGAKLYGDVTVETMGETTRFQNLLGVGELTVLLPSGVTNACEAKFTLRRGERSLTQAASIPAQRQWTLYVYPHSHVDIGYTSLQSVVEETHKRNMMEAIKLGKQTKNYPEGARYRWGTEASWQVERFLNSATPKQKQELFDGIRRGYVNVDAAYANVNTSVCADEELIELLRPSQKIASQTGRPADVVVQTDVPGMSWGMVPVLAKAGMRYILALPNASARIGHSRDLDHAPFWWVGPDGTSKVLFFQPYDYIQGIVKMQAVLRMHPDWDWNNKMSVDQIPPVYRTDNPRSHFLDGYLSRILPTLEKSPAYPYDIFFVTWSMIDNSPLDADLSDAVKSWNEEYAFPHLIISSAHDMFRAFEKKYGAQLPVRRGDFTEYWTDGVGSGARETSMNRTTAERLIQADTLWTMLHRSEPAPRAEFDEAWRNVILGSEHTWGGSNTSPENYFNREIWRVKQGYFREAENRSKTMLAAALAPVAATNSETIAVFNTLSWPRTGLVTLPAGVAGIAGEPTQKLSSGETVFLAKDVPALGVKNYQTGTGSVTVVGCKVGDLTLENGLVTVALDPKTGDIASIKDKAGNEYVNGSANTYRYLNGGDAPSKAVAPREVKISIKENGSLVASLLVESDAAGCDKLVREVRIVAGQPDVEIINTLEKSPVRAKEGVHFGFAFNVPEPRTRMDIPWGVAEVEKDQFPEGNRNWIGFQRWLDISGKDRGVTWCSLDAPLFEYGDITANIMGAGGAWIRKLNPSATVYSWALNNHWFTNFPLSQDGQITFRYQILPHNTGYDVVAANRFGMEQARPLIASTVKEKINLAPLVTVDNPRVVVSSIKSQTKGVVVTLRSLSDKEETIKLNRAGSRVKSVTLRPNGFASVTIP